MDFKAGVAEHFKQERSFLRELIGKQRDALLNAYLIPQ